MSLIKPADQLLASTRICIVTPGQIGSNPRTVKEADALSAAGAKVTVVATQVLDAVEPRDQAVMHSARWELARVDLRGRKAWRARRLGQIAARLGYVATRWRRFADYGLSPFALALRRPARLVPADLYIAHYPAALPAVAAAARRHRAAYAFDAEDYHFGDAPNRPEFELERRLIREVEACYLPSAAYVTAASPGIAEAYALAYGIAQPTIVLNVFPRSDGPPTPTERGVAEPGPSIYWFSQTIGPDRGLECAIRALAAAKSRPHLYLRGHLVTGYDAVLKELAHSLECGDRLHFLSPAAPADMVQLATKYDIGLASEIGHTAARNCALTNKLFTYLLAGLPILVSDTPAQWHFAAGKEACLVSYGQNDPAALAAAMDTFLSDPEKLWKARKAAFEIAQTQYNWDVEQRALLQVVANSLSKVRKVD